MREREKEAQKRQMHRHIVTAHENMQNRTIENSALDLVREFGLRPSALEKRLCHLILLWMSIYWNQRSGSKAANWNHSSYFHGNTLHIWLHLYALIALFPLLIFLFPSIPHTFCFSSIIYFFVEHPKQIPSNVLKLVQSL